jgi:hypothetical protein
MARSGEIQNLQDVLTALEGTRAGYPIAAAIRERGTAVRFGQAGGEVVAYFDPERNEIVLNEGMCPTACRTRTAA